MLSVDSDDMSHDPVVPRHTQSYLVTTTQSYLVTDANKKITSVDQSVIQQLVDLLHQATSCQSSKKQLMLVQV